MKDHRQLNRHYARWGVVFFLVAGIAVLTGCENTRLGGLTRAEVKTANGDEWDVVSGRDETDVTFTVSTAPDGTRTVTYSANTANASSVIKTLAEQNAAMIQVLLQKVGAP